MKLVSRLMIAAALGVAVYVVLPATSPLRRGEREAVPKPPARPRPSPVAARGIHIGIDAQGSDRFDALVAMVRRTELNAVVLDVKDDGGLLAWVPRSPRLRAAGTGRPVLDDPPARLRRLRAAGIYPIARVVAFRDPALAAIRPDLAVQDRRGGLWRDADRRPWLDPYSAEVWRYVIDVAREAVDAGFAEVQLDFVRFPSSGDPTRALYPHQDLRSHEEVIAGFLFEARRAIVPLGAYLSVVPADGDLELVAFAADYLSPALYPSRLPKPSFGIADPEREPYRAVSAALADVRRRLGRKGPRIRPWLQDFTARLPYSPAEVREQIRAMEDAGQREWLLWNANNRYSEDALRPRGRGGA